MTETKSIITPLLHPQDCTATLEDILITPELHRRPSRGPDYASENCVLVALAHEMALTPCRLLQTLVDKAVDLCRAGTAGISVPRTDTDGEYLAWEALSGRCLHLRSRRTDHLTNALKYAFPDGRSGNIYIMLRAADEYVILSVRDTGIGFPEGFDFRNAESLGLQLVGMMTEQLGGTLTLTCEGGTTFTVSIPYRTAYADELTMAQARTPQPVLAIHKPFDISQLRQTLEQALTAPQ